MKFCKVLSFFLYFLRDRKTNILTDRQTWVSNLLAGDLIKSVEPVAMERGVDKMPSIPSMDNGCIVRWGNQEEEENFNEMRKKMLEKQRYLSSF